METEIWKPVKGFKGLYLVSNTGKVKSLHTSKKKELKPYKNRNGYLYVNLNNKGDTKCVTIHRLVAIHFLSSPIKETVNHIDGNKVNNNIQNLEWATKHENMTHAHDTGLRVQPKGEKWCRSKLKNKDVEAIKILLNKGFTNKYLADLFNVTPAAITDIKSGKTWSWLKL